MGKVAAKVKAKAKARERAETVRRSPSATTEARAMATASTQQRATSHMMARKEAGRRREPMVVKTLDRQGNGVLIFDPSAVYLDQAELDETQARFRIFGQARLRQRGLGIVQDKNRDDLDYLTHKGGEIEIPLEIVDDIITVKTLPVTLTREQREGLTHHMDKNHKRNGCGPRRHRSGNMHESHIK